MLFFVSNVIINYCYQVLSISWHSSSCSRHFVSAFSWKKSLKIPKGVIRIRISKKNRQHNGQKKKYKRTNNDLRGLLLKRKLLNQGFLLVKLKSSLRQFYGRHYDLVDRYGISASQMTMDMFHCCWNVATYEWKVHNGKIEIISFVVEFRS
jgi:hypothetical protein